MLTKPKLGGIVYEHSREWRNRQTRTFEGRVVIPYGFKSRLSHQNRVITFVIALFFCYDFDGTWTREGLSVKKTVQWTVFSEEREAGTEIRRIWVAERIVCKA